MKNQIFSEQCYLRIGPSMFGFFILTMLLILNKENFAVFRFLVSIQDGFHLNPPFGDIGAILKAHACWQQHINVYQPNYCMEGGEYNYSPILLHNIFVPYSLDNQFKSGFFLCGCFILAQGLLPGARSFAEVAFRCVALASPATIFALSQANLDVLIFVVITISISLISYVRILKLLGYLFIVLLAAIKYYPAVALILIFRERLIFAITLSILILIFGVLFLICYFSETISSIAIIPEFQPFRATFGSIDFPLGLIIIHILPTVSNAIKTAHFDPKTAGAAGLISAQMLANILTIIAIIFGFLKRNKFKNILLGKDTVSSVFLIAAATILVFCFSAAQNLYYRAIFLILTIPALWKMGATEGEQPTFQSRFLAWAALLLLWQSAFIVLIEKISLAILPQNLTIYPYLLFWIFKEALWWWVVIQYYAIIFCFLKLSYDYLTPEFYLWKTKFTRGK